MLFVIRFTDKPDSFKIRYKYLKNHISWLSERRDSVLVAGSLRDEPVDSHIKCTAFV
jgi:uncharacterized protein YciI